MRYEELLSQETPETLVARNIKDANASRFMTREYFPGPVVTMFSPAKCEDLIQNAPAFHTLARFLSYSGNRSVSGNVCVAFVVHEKTMYFAANRETTNALEERAASDFNRNHPYAPYRDLVDVQRRKALFARFKSEFEGDVCKADLSHVQKVDSCDLPRLVLGEMLSIVTDETLGDQIGLMLGSLANVSQSNDAMLRELLRLLHEFRKPVEERARDPVLFSELVILLSLAPQNTVKCEALDAKFLKALCRYAVWRGIRSSSSKMLVDLLRQGNDNFDAAYAQGNEQQVMNLMHDETLTSFREDGKLESFFDANMGNGTCEKSRGCDTAVRVCSPSLFGRQKGRILSRCPCL